jgi:TRAP-type transport system periplasmic protein
MKDKGVPPIRLAAWALTALAAITLVAAPALAQTKELRFGHLHSAESPIHKGVTKAAEEFAKSTSGRYKVNVFPSSQLGAAREMVAQVIDGTLDFISEGPGSLSNLNKALSLFEAPFVSRDWDHVPKMLASPFGQEQLGKLAHDRNMVHVGTFYHGVRHFTTKNKPLQTAADVKGLKIRVPEAPLFLAMIRALEATPTPMSLGEVYLSLQTGVADGQENSVGHHQRPEVLRGPEVPEADRPRHRADSHHGEQEALRRDDPGGPAGPPRGVHRGSEGQRRADARQ